LAASESLTSLKTYFHALKTPYRTGGCFGWKNREKGLSVQQRVFVLHVVAFSFSFVTRRIVPVFVFAVWSALVFSFELQTYKPRGFARETLGREDRFGCALSEFSYVLLKETQDKQLPQVHTVRGQ